MRARIFHSTSQAGEYQPIVAGGDLLLFVRIHGDDRVLVALNLGGEATAVEFQPGKMSGTVLMSSLGDRDHEIVTSGIDLRGHEGLIVELAADANAPRGREERSDVRRHLRG